jgi:PKD repeat protein
MSVRRHHLSQVAKGRVWTSRRIGALAVVTGLLLAAGPAVLADGEWVGHSIGYHAEIRILEATEGPDPFSPGILDGNLDANDLHLVFASGPLYPENVKPARSMNPLDIINTASFNRHMLVRMTYVLTDAAGHTVRTIEQNVEYTQPLDIVELEWRDYPAVPWARIEATLTWDGKDDAGALVPDGVYSYEMRADLFSYADDPAGGDYDYVTPIGDYVLAESEPVTGTIEVDNTPPLITIEGIPDGCSNTDVSPHVTFEDVNLDATSASLDGEPFSNGQTVAAEGHHALEATASDLAGNSSAAGADFDIDKTIPSISVDAPLDGSVVETDRPDFLACYSDDGCGIDVESFRATLDGRDVTSLFAIDANCASWTPSEDEALKSGAHSFEARITDTAGNPASSTSNFTVTLDEGLRAIASGVPTSGNAPLKVTFSEAGEDPSSTIDFYAWDFDGDGNYDTCDPDNPFYWWRQCNQVAQRRDHTYHEPGVYNATLLVQNVRGERATDAVVITVNASAPEVEADARPSNGAAPLTVNFYGSASDPDGTVELYEWDFDGDGTYDWSSPTTGNTSYVYDEAGTFEAVFRATDDDGNSSTAPALLTEVRVGPEGSPTAIASASPDAGVTPLDVSLRGDSSYDDNGSIVLYEWDFDGDGTFDESSATPNTSHVYELPGSYIAALRVTDDEDLTGTDYVLIEASLSASLTVVDDNDTLDLGAGERVEIRTSISSPARVWLEFRDRSGQVSATLVDGVDRAAGTYSDFWDGSDGQGGTVLDGVHFSILRYEINGEIDEIDLTETTGNARTRPRRNSWYGTNWARPYKDSPAPITFHLPTAGYVELFVGELWYNERIRTILNRVPFPAGSHRWFWDGFNDADEIRRPLSRFVLGLWEFSLPDNALFVTGGRPRITDVALTPNYFNPFSRDCEDGEDALKVSFELSVAADAELEVYSLETRRIVARRQFLGLAAGGNQVSWDGRDDQGYFVPTGDYRVGIIGTDDAGNSSLLMYSFARIRY